MSNKMLARKTVTPTTLRAGGGGRSHVRGYFDTTLLSLCVLIATTATLTPHTKHATLFNHTYREVEFLLLKSLLRLLCVPSLPRSNKIN